jgi:hypothetical protein
MLFCMMVLAGFPLRDNRDHPLIERYFAYKMMAEHPALVPPKHLCPCGVSAVQAHHSDYARPFDIEWLCRRHHKAADRKRQQVESCQPAHK